MDLESMSTKELHGLFDELVSEMADRGVNPNDGYRVPWNESQNQAYDDMPMGLCPTPDSVVSDLRAAVAPQDAFSLFASADAKHL